MKLLRNTKIPRMSDLDFTILIISECILIVLFKSIRNKDITKEILRRNLIETR